MLNKSIKSSLDKILLQYEKYQEQTQNSDIISDISTYTKLLKKISDIQEIVDKYKIYLDCEKAIIDSKELLKTEKDHELIEMAKIEISENEKKILQLITELKILLLPKDPLDERNIIVEIRGAAGGDEANIFALDLFRMYQKWISHSKKLKIEILEAQYSSNGGINIIVFQVNGTKPYSKLKYETGSHRVQRIPLTETNGRVHTSTAVVTVLPEADETEEIKIKPEEIKIDTYRSSGAGGQSVNTTDSAIRITHLATNIVVTSQDQRSQNENKMHAMKILKAKLFQLELEKKAREESNLRKTAGTGDRSEKIRTYNYPQNRVTDHRIGFSSNALNKIMNGDLDPIINALTAAEQAKKINETDI